MTVLGMRGMKGTLYGDHVREVCESENSMVAVGV